MRRVRATRHGFSGDVGPADAEPGAPPAFVMSHKMWVAQYSMDPAVVGRTFVLNGIPTTCVGVMPPRFTKQGAEVDMITVAAGPAGGGGRGRLVQRHPDADNTPPPRHPSKPRPWLLEGLIALDRVGEDWLQGRSRY